MSGFAVGKFGGIQPVSDPRKLLVGGAVEAIDCDLQATDLRTFSPLKYIADVVSNIPVQRSGFVFDETHMFIFENEVDATYGPIRAEEDRDNRVFFSYGFQDFPSYSTKYLGLEQHGLDSVPYYGPPLDWRKLGVIPGPTAPIVSVTNAITLSKFFCTLATACFSPMDNSLACASVTGVR